LNTREKVIGQKNNQTTINNKETEIKNKERKSINWRSWHFRKNKNNYYCTAENNIYQM